MKNLELGLPVIDGNEVQPDAALAFIDERELLEVTVNDGQHQALFKMIVNPARIRATDVEKYQNRVTDLALEADDLEQEGERLQAQADAIEPSASEPAATIQTVEGVQIDEVQSTALAVIAQPGAEAVAESVKLTRETLRVVSASLSLSRRMAEAKADLLFLAIEAWNVPGVEPSAFVLTQRTGVGPAAMAMLETWFFPTSPPAAAATGETEIPSSENTSASSEQTPGGENTPPIS